MVTIVTYFTSLAISDHNLSSTKNFRMPIDDLNMNIHIFMRRGRFCPYLPWSVNVTNMYSPVYFNIIVVAMSRLAITAKNLWNISIFEQNMRNLQISVII